MCGRIKAFAELLARSLEQAEAMATIQGRKACSRCVGAWNVAKGSKDGGHMKAFDALASWWIKRRATRRIAWTLYGVRPRLFESRARTVQRCREVVRRVEAKAVREMRSGPSWLN